MVKKLNNFRELNAKSLSVNLNLPINKIKTGLVNLANPAIVGDRIKLNTISAYGDGFENSGDMKNFIHISTETNGLHHTCFEYGCVETAILGYLMIDAEAYLALAEKL